MRRFSGDWADLEVRGFDAEARDEVRDMLRKSKLALWFCAGDAEWYAS